MGPGDLYRFLITGAETGGAYFAMEAIVPPGGAPPPHVAARYDAAAPRYGLEFLIE